MKSRSKSPKHQKSPKGHKREKSPKGHKHQKSSECEKLSKGHHHKQKKYQESQTVPNIDTSKSLSTKSLPARVVFVMRNFASKRYLRCGVDNPSDELTDANTCESGIERHGQWLYWYAQKNTDGTYCLRNTYTGRWLRSGKDNNNQNTQAFTSQHGHEQHGDWINWFIQLVQPYHYTVQNEATRRYMRAGSGSGQQTNAQTAKHGIDQHGDWVKWEFIPVGIAYNIFLHNFEFDNPQEVISTTPFTPDVIGSDTLEIHEGTVGSSVERQYSKTISQSFSFTYQHSYGIKGEMKFSVGVPLIAKAQILIQGTATWGQSQTWDHSQSTTITLKSILKPESTGVYRMRGIVDIIDDGRFTYTAQCQITAKGYVADSNGNLVIGADIPSQDLEAILRSSQDEVKVLSSAGNELVVQVRGQMRGTYGTQTYTTTEKISELP